jgi:hypothetical protein
MAHDDLFLSEMRYGTYVPRYIHSTVESTAVGDLWGAKSVGTVLGGNRKRKRQKAARRAGDRAAPR